MCLLQMCDIVSLPSCCSQNSWDFDLRDHLILLWYLIGMRMGGNVKNLVNCVRVGFDFEISWEWQWEWERTEWECTGPFPHISTLQHPPGVLSARHYDWPPTTQSSNIATCEIPRTLTSLGAWSFTVARQQLWNNLPLRPLNSPYSPYVHGTVFLPASQH